MDSMEQGFCRLDKKKQDKEIAISKGVALFQCIAAITVVVSLVLLIAFYGFEYMNGSVTVASFAPSKPKANAAGQPLITTEQREGRTLLNAAYFPVDSMKSKVATAPSNSRIVVNVPSCTLDFYSENRLVKTYHVAVGKPTTPTPLGNFVITQKEINPWWYPPRKKIAVPSGPDNPLGYRWMGFAPLYGIHGTNTPWEIGSSVSNGCIRMYEEDVEELYQMTPYGTAVNIIYDLVRVEVSNAGQASLGIYSDVYRNNRRQVTVAEIKQKLSAAGIPGFMNEQFLQDAIKQQAGRQVDMLQMHNLKVNGKLLSAKVIASQGRVFVPIWAVVGAFQVEVVWDEPTQQMYFGNHVVHCSAQGDILYASAEDIQLLFGGMWLWQQGENCWELVTLNVAKK